MNKTNKIGTIILNQKEILIQGDIFFISELENSKDIQEIDCNNNVFLIKTSKYYYLVNNIGFKRFDITSITKLLKLSDYFILFYKDKVEVYDDKLSILSTNIDLNSYSAIYIAGNKLLCKDNNVYWFYLNPLSEKVILNDVNITVNITNSTYKKYNYYLKFQDITNIYSVNEGYIFVINNKLIYWNETILDYKNTIEEINCENNADDISSTFILNILLNNIKVDNLTVYSSPNEFYIKNHNFLHVFPYTIDNCNNINEYIKKITSSYYDINNQISNIVVSDYLYFLKDNSIYTMNYLNNVIDHIIYPIPDINNNMEPYKNVNSFYIFGNGLIYNDNNFIQLTYNLITINLESINQITNFLYMYNKITKNKLTLLINYIETSYKYNIDTEYSQLQKIQLNTISQNEMFKRFISTSFQNLSYKHVNEIMKLYIKNYIDIGKTIVFCNINPKFIDDFKNINSSNNNNYYKLLMKNILEQEQQKNCLKIFNFIYKSNKVNTPDIDYNKIYNYLKTFINTDIIKHIDNIKDITDEQKCEIINLYIPLYKYANLNNDLINMILTITDYDNLWILLQIFQKNLFYKNDKQITTTELQTIFIKHTNLNTYLTNILNQKIIY